MNNVERIKDMLDTEFTEIPNDVKTLDDFDKWLSGDVGKVYELEEGGCRMKLRNGSAKSSSFKITANGKVVAVGIELGGNTLI